MRKTTTNMEEQTITVPLKAGDYVTLYENVDMDDQYGYIADVLYEGRVERHVPETNLIEFSDGTGRSEFLDLLDQADGYEVM